MSWNTHSGVVLTCSAMPVPMAGIISSAVVSHMVRPPQDADEEGGRDARGGTDRPAAASEMLVGGEGKPALAICTVMIPHIIHMAKPSRLGMEIHRLQLAIREPWNPSRRPRLGAPIDDGHDAAGDRRARRRDICLHETLVVLRIGPWTEVDSAVS